MKHWELSWTLSVLLKMLRSLKPLLIVGAILTLLASILGYLLYSLSSWGTCPSTIVKQDFLPTPKLQGVNYAIRSSFVYAWSCEARQDIELVRYKNSREESIELITAEFESAELSRDSAFKRTSPKKDFQYEIAIDYIWESKTMKLIFPVNFTPKENFRWFDLQIEFKVDKNQIVT